MAQHRPRRPELVEAHPPVEDIAPDQAERALQAFGAEYLPRQDRGAKARRVRLDGVDDRVRRCGFLLRRPFQRRIELLAEQAGDMMARRREAVVDLGGNQHLDNRFARPSVRLGVGERPVHVIEAGCDHDPRTQMLARSGQAGKVGQPIERDIHAEAA